MRDLRTYSAGSLVRLHYQVADELKKRGISRSASAPIGEWAELLFCEAFNWTRADGCSNAGFDATDKDGSRIQVKARRLVGLGSRQLGSIRNLDRNPFDKLAAILFAKDLSVARAAVIPIEVVRQQSCFDAHTNSSRFILEDAIWNIPEVQDVTDRIRIAATEPG